MLFPVREVEVDGVQMGVLSDGTPYLTARGLALMCGIDRKVMLRLTTEWAEEQSRPRGIKIRQLLESQGHPGDSLFVRFVHRGNEVLAHTDAVCMAVLEYYAFEASKGTNATALGNFRLLARHSFRRFIYDRCGFDPDKHLPDCWRNFNERMLLNDTIPADYFSIFREISVLVVNMIRKGCPVDEHTVPDVSVGQAWSKHWAEAGLEATHGVRRKHPHDYPSWFPQSAAGPIEAWIYPISALGAFRVWLYADYVPVNFPKYLDGKIKSKALPADRAGELIDAVGQNGFAGPRPPRSLPSPGRP